MSDASNERTFLADHGKTDYVIVVAADASPSEAHAAQELKAFLDQSTGAQFAIIPDSDPPGAREIMVGQSRHTKMLAIGAVPADLGDEEFAIKSIRGHLVIAGGRRRGTLYGVYEFLERFVGCRWFRADVSSIPRHDVLALRPITMRKRTKLEYREPYCTEFRDGDLAARNRANSSAANLGEQHGGKVTYGPFVHTFEHLLPVAEHFSEHPEWYSEIDGTRTSDHTQLCLTNPEVLERMIEGVRDWIRRMPEATIFSVSQNDWLNPCQCEKCREIDEQEGSHAGSLLQFVNQVAEAIEEEAPHVAIDTLAYQYTRTPPKTIRPRQNVIVRLCSIECCFAHPLESCPENASFVEDIRGWSAIADRLYVWDYVTNFHNYVMPWPNLNVLGPNVRFFARNNVVGLFEQGNYSAGGGGEMADLRGYVLAKLLWDPNVDEEAVRQEFLDGVYGKAAPHIAEYLDLIHEPTADPNMHMHIFCDVDSPHITGTVILRADIALGKALAAAESDEVRRRVEVARLPVDYVGIRRMADDDPARRTLLDRFVAIAEREGITNISEQCTIDRWVEKGARDPSA